MAKKAARRPTRKPKVKTGKKTLAKLAPGQSVNKLRSSLKDILGVAPKEVSFAFNKKLSPGGIRASDGSWDGNIYKYRY